VEPLEERRVLTGLIYDGAVLSSGLEGTAESAAATGGTVDAAGNQYVVGRFNGVHDFDPLHHHAGSPDVLTPRGSGDGFIAKYGPDGAFQWARHGFCSVCTI
jgi:hypothetical protein